MLYTKRNMLTSFQQLHISNDMHKYDYKIWNETGLVHYAHRNFIGSFKSIRIANWTETIKIQNLAVTLIAAITARVPYC